METKETATCTGTFLSRLRGKTRIRDSEQAFSPESRVDTDSTLAPPDDPDKHPFFNYCDNFDEYPKGLPRLARTQNFYHNGPFHRLFGTLRQRLMLESTIELASAERQLLELDRREEMTNVSILCSMEEPSAERKKLNDKIYELAGRHDSLLDRDRKLRKLHRVNREEISDWYESIKLSNMLDEKGREFITEIDDFVTTSPDYSNYPLEALMLGREKPWIKFIMRYFLFKRPEDTPKSATYASHFDVERVKSAVAIAVVGSVLLMLDVPIVVLYLLEPPRYATVLIVTLCGTAVGGLMMKVPNVRVDIMFVVLSAYMAVLVTFLANM